VAGCGITVAGIVLVRQKPASAKGVLFITIEDEIGTGNLIVWRSTFGKRRRVILSVRMIACRGPLQREGDVIHIGAEDLIEFSDLLASVGGRDDAFPFVYRRNDHPTRSVGPNTHDGLRAANTILRTFLPQDPGLSS
jgi:error-prone DNA polymerase